jgi:hypothetical protein
VVLGTGVEKLKKKKKKKINTRKPMKMTKMFCSGPGKK